MLSPPSADRLLRSLAWLALVLIAAFTISPIGLRPHSGFSPQLERFLAFGVIGVLFALAYPRHVLVTAAIVVGAAVALELLQLLAQSRHARALDAAVKIAGGLLGVVGGSVAARLIAARRRE